MSVLEGSNAQENWATDFGSVVDGGGSNKAGEVKDVLGAIAGSRGGSSSIASTQSGWQWQSPKPSPLPPPLPALQVSLAREVMVRMLLYSSLLLLVGVWNQ
jgi:hypothetical protein